MKTLLLIIILANMFVSCGSTEQAAEVPQPSKINFKGEPLPEIKLYSGIKMTFFYDTDNKFELNPEDIKTLDAVIEYIRVNPNYNVYMHSFMHENEQPDINKKRAKFIKDRALEAGINERRFLATIVKPLIPQGEIDAFTPEELVNARRVDLQIIK